MQLNKMITMRWYNIGCSHNPMSQKGCRITKKNNKNWINIYVLSFKAMVIKANYCFFYSYECQGIQTKNAFDEILSLNFDLKPLKVNSNVLDMNQFYKGLSKGLI